MSIEKIKKGDELTQSLDIVNDNITRLKELFPEVFTEGKIDFKVLQDILGDEIENEEEYYRFTWAGKAQARREAHKPSTGTLRPAKDESVNWETTKNLYIEGDNLEVLKLLQKSYNNKVKMIYIDPPYNTGKDFVYKDNYKDNLKNYQEVTGQIDADGNKLSTNSDSDGRFHSNWLNMMYPRLKLARNLLSEDGILFVSLDEHEGNNLKNILNEIFGETNLIAELIWKNKHGGGGDSPYIVKEHEYIFMYCKNLALLPNLFSKPAPEYDKMFREKDEKGKFYFDRLDKKGIDANRPNLIYPIECPDGTLKDISPAIWRLSKEEFFRRKENNEIGFKKDKNDEWQIYTKTYLFDENGVKRRVKARSILKQEIVGFTQNGNKECEEMLGKNIFSNPKPVNLIQYLIDIVCKDDKECLILDFFSGSATTAHATMQLNNEDSGNRKFIQIQLPQDVDLKSEAFKSGYKVISEIGKERIRRASKKIAEENPAKAKDLDLGFKVFKLDSSNIKGWDGNPDNLEQSLFDSQDNIKTDRTEEDVLFEILLKYGLDLTLPIEEKIIEGKKVFNVGFGALFICLADGITNKVAEGIGAWKQEINPESCRAIFKDTGFTDVEKTNAVQTLKRFGIHEIKSI
jgi:adenine-specific DNA-methyltransferase